jgi:hypothetical protein
VIQAAQVVKLGYRWVVGDGTKIRFWEDSWFGSVPLAVQFWELYYVCNEKTRTMTELWVDGELRVTFRRTFTEPMMHSGDNLLSFVKMSHLGMNRMLWCGINCRYFLHRQDIGWSRLCIPVLRWSCEL